MRSGHANRASNSPKQAKERVLFDTKEWNVEEIGKSTGFVMFKFKHKEGRIMVLNNPTIDGIMEFEFELTKTAQNQIGL